MCIRDRAVPVGAMGDDTPPAAMSKLPRPLFHYFKQRFAEVTNPPIDPLREELVMSLRMLLGKRANLLSETPEAVRLIALSSPILSPEQMAALRTQTMPEFATATVDAVWQAPSGEEVTPEQAGAALRAAVEKLCRDAEEAVRNGARILFISDEKADVHTLPIPALLAIGAVHPHLIRQGLRMRASLVSVSGEPREVHHFACLIGYGANAVYPYLAYETIEELVHEGRKTGNLTVEQARKNFIKAIDKGLLKVMSKMGISTIDAYCGAQIFEAIGIGQELLDVAFVDTPSLLGGIGFASVAEDVLAWHQYGYPNSDLSQAVKLVTWGLYKARRGGELHEWSPQVVHALTQVARPKKPEDIPTNYRKYADLINSMKLAPRHLLDFRRIRPSIPVTQVEPVERILRRFSTAAMSHGALSAEAHETLAIAMNRLGGMSNSGEGGEAKERYFTERASRIKQVASGRFGVTPESLMSADELQIKMAQGAKPGEGGQLPGHKVSEYIGYLRHSVPGVGLISPPPHHDIYSIEDLAQLIHDLKNANPNASISVKLVSEVGVGTVAAGVSKAKADHVVISGFDGGTGASPLSSIKHAGTPWELGLAETQQTLVLNRLRGRIRVQVDGQMKTGRDVIIGALLGADEFGFATAPLVVEGCLMMRKCHLNTCPVGVATQDPILRRRFSGQPEHVVNYFFFVAEEARQIMAQMGIRKLDELIGRTDLLDMRHGIAHWKAKGLDFSKLFHMPPLPEGVARHHCETQDHNLGVALDHQLIAQAKVALEDRQRVVIETPISNVNRTVGTLLSYEVARRYGNAGLPDDTIHIKLAGTAGQSFGAFLARGITLELTGEANDYVGKGLSGGRIVVKPPQAFKGAPTENIIVIGNTVMYGAIEGEAFFRGVAGERFCVRNSGAQAVVEGTGDHGCEYMTGGTVVVLGATGRNFAAGMSGGIAYVLDEDGMFAKRCNLSMVALEKVEPAQAQAGDALLHRGEADETQLQRMIEQHALATGSERARQILADWGHYRTKFVKVFPHEYRRALTEMAAANARKAA
ncbi:MAG: glutamate synthase large subunit, partial [Rhodocyclaceae bacterium]|nr:glutamate synthase large subunit [Rhodocyclaceae bacterium]